MHYPESSATSYLYLTLMLHQRLMTRGTLQRNPFNVQATPEFAAMQPDSILGGILTQIPFWLVHQS